MGGIEKNVINNNVYLKIVDGSLRQKVEKGFVGAIAREWKAGGKEGTTHELSHKAAFGLITKIEIYEGEYEGKKFQTLNVHLDENDIGMTPVVSVGLATKYAQDLMKKLPNVNLKEEVRIRPYKYLPEGEEKDVTGVEITQRDHTGNFEKKIQNHFIKKTVDKKGTETWTPTNGFPVREKAWSDQTDEEREIYKIQCRGFLSRYTREHYQELTANETQQQEETSSQDDEPSKIDRSFDEAYDDNKAPF